MNATLGSTSSVQRRVFENKKNQGFNITDISMEFCLTYGELSEAYDAWTKKRNSLGEELADVAIYLLGLAEITGCDLGSEIDRKMAINENRVYKKDSNGIPTRLD